MNKSRTTRIEIWLTLVAVAALAGVWWMLKPAGMPAGKIIQAPGRYESPHQTAFAEIQEVDSENISFRFGNLPPKHPLFLRGSNGLGSYELTIKVKPLEWFAVWDRIDRVWLYTGFEIQWGGVIGMDVTGGNTWINWDEMPDEFRQRLPSHARSDYERHLQSVIAHQNLPVKPPSSAGENPLDKSEEEQSSAGER